MNDPHTKPIVAPRILVMGIGSSGADAVATMCANNPELDALIIDSDAKHLESLPQDKVMHIGESVTSGFSGGGDAELGRQALASSASEIRERLKSVDLLLIAGGLGKGVGSGAIPVMVRIAREANTMTLCMLSMPFNFEGARVAEEAKKALNLTRMHADSIIRIKNEDLIDRSESHTLSEEDIFTRSHQVMNDGIVSLWRVLSKKGICGLDFASIQTILSNCDGFCRFANGEAEGEGRADEVTSQILNHRLLSGEKVFAAASGVVIGITGGTDLTLHDIETVMNGIQEKLPTDTWVNFGVITDEAFTNRLSVIALVAEQWKTPLIPTAQKTGELPLEFIGKGKFLESEATILNNQNMDVPTYIRRQIKLPR